MRTRILSRVAAAALTTGVLAAGLVAGSSGSANATSDIHPRQAPVVTDAGPDGWTADDGGVTTQRLDTGWG